MNIRENTGSNMAIGKVLVEDIGIGGLRTLSRNMGLRKTEDIGLRMRKTESDVFCAVAKSDDKMLLPVLRSHYKRKYPIILKEKNILLGTKNLESLDNILDSTIITGKDYYLGKNGKLEICEASKAKKVSFELTKNKINSVIEFNKDKLNKLDEQYKEAMEFYTTQSENISKYAPKIKGKVLDFLLQKSPNITPEIILQSVYAKTPEQFRPSIHDLKEVANILNNRVFIDGKNALLERNAIKKTLDKANNDLVVFEKQIKINDTKCSEIKQSSNGNFEIFIHSPLEAERPVYDLIRITPADKEMYEKIISAKYSNLVDVKNIHVMHRLMQRFAGATDKATPVDFEKMTKFLDYISDIKANPMKYNVTGGKPIIQNGDVRIGFQLVSGDTSRGGCSLLLPRPNSEMADMIIFSKDGKITTTIAGVKQSAIDTNFVPIQLID